MTAETASAAEILAAARSGNSVLAKALLSRMIEEEFGFRITEVVLGADDYSLNSVNGFMTRADGEQFFFKFHHEENEDSVLQEFYRGEILLDAGFPVDMPAYVCRRVGRQILLYARKTIPKLADAARAADHGTSLPGAEKPALIQAQQELDQLSATLYLRSWHPITAKQSADEPIHQLFHHRLTSPGQPFGTLGGRAARFFAPEREFIFPGTVLTGSKLLELNWVIDGVRYDRTLKDCFHKALSTLSPESLARSGGVVAHGDAHNANVWFNPDSTSLTLFDPAFAGRHIPALLAEIKATFHNIFAHPDWLYHSAELTSTPEIRISNNTAFVTTHWSLTPLRRIFLRDKARLLWRPLLKGLAERNALPAHWRETIRSGLFCCPTLVMDLCARSVTNPTSRHTPASSLTGLAISMMCGAEPDGEDVISCFLGAIDPANTMPQWNDI
ncbi:hypothetical protein [Gluconobacter roseus]|uniref:Aminoglycoside phosphotransferase domain-containing protein n=1 Tax=Gluconobacter roseus NBRC 3990 TaxID=1307950 RepID=A0A4Y3M4B5_9PROT|nr:hypothetical protein [Gluconobacter roseus]KXV44403.1 hypothetical protein AD943_03810 [Gluconobacter roseus]GBR47972.1 hypothetical protein AA3990_1956 [Gluconobacter roseus NBRC 3990]GEB03463.1 hypothetical protein GRO01_10390 [Gluconobacter roseus NBRC 3990]GLP93918.1 hypothetical protein GCM10007871_18960 [Gluconobacter roseus NBRC 3990]